MSNIINYMMQDLYINNKAFNLIKYTKLSDDYRISYDKFSKYIEKYIETLNFNILNPLLDKISIDELKKYFYLCITLNKELLKEDIESLILDSDYFTYNLIVLNTLLYK
jgi:hypothetical protein